MSSFNKFLFNNNATVAQQYNVNLLAIRGKGERFRVDAEGKLVKIEGLFYHLYSYIFRKSVQNQVKEAISIALTSIDSDKTQEPEIRRLFFDNLQRLSEQVFDRSEIPVDIINKLRSLNMKPVTDPMAARVQEVRFAVSLGVEFQRVSEGDCGTYFGRDYKGKRLVVFKPFDEESSSSNSVKFASKIKKIIFHVFPFLRTHNNIKRECAYLNEVGASVVDRFLGTQMVPETHLMEFTSSKFSEPVQKLGSCQLYVEDTVMLQHKIGLPSFDFLPFANRLLQKLWLFLFGEERPLPCTEEDLKKWAIIDFLVGNQDGHLNNQLSSPNGLKLIDYGLAFPSRPADNELSTINQYQFIYFKEAAQSFNRSDHHLIQALGDPDALCLELRQVMNDGNTIGFDQDQEEAMRERIEILRQVVLQGKSVRYLGEIKYASDFERARSELGLLSQS